jgi:hypothetical protein
MPSAHVQRDAVHKQLQLCSTCSHWGCLRPVSIASLCVVAVSIASLCVVAVSIASLCVVAVSIASLCVVAVIALCCNDKSRGDLLQPCQGDCSMSVVALAMVGAPGILAVFQGCGILTRTSTWVIVPSCARSITKSAGGRWMTMPLKLLSEHKQRHPTAGV